MTAAVWALPLRAVGERWPVGLGACALLPALYYGGLLAVMAARVGHLPNYGLLYDAPGAYAMIWRSTPSLRDALQIMADEPLFEVGYKIPEFGIAEWSLLVDLPNLLQVLAAAALLTTFVLLHDATRRAGCPTSRAGAAAAGASAGVLALCSASLTWVVCCATPSWTVALSLLGVSLGVAQLLGPFDSAALAVGAAAALLAIGMQARQLAQRQQTREPARPDARLHGRTPSRVPPRAEEVSWR